MAAVALELSSRDGLLYANGADTPFFFKGANWFGAEAFNGPPRGLHRHPMSYYLDFLAAHDFNAIRLLFNHESVLKNDIVEITSDELLAEPLLFQVRYLDMFKQVAREAARRGILIMLACHRIKPDSWPGAGLWYDESLGYPEDRIKESWTRLSEALCGTWNVVAVDLQNEPHGSSWGKGMPIDWNHGAERLGNHVLQQCSRWLVMVEGVGYSPGAPGGDDPAAGFWWGENLVGARVAPVRLEKPNKLVYSPHVYGPSVYQQHYFDDPSFPANMPAVWEEHFAFAKELTRTPVVLGEFGGRYVDQDRQWQDWALPYCVQNGFGMFYFALNPDSADTGGLLTRNWTIPPADSVEALKLAALAQLPSTRVHDVCPLCNSSSAYTLTRQRPTANDATTVFALFGAFGLAGLLYVMRLVYIHLGTPSGRSNRYRSVPLLNEKAKPTPPLIGGGEAPQADSIGGKGRKKGASGSSKSARPNLLPVTATDGAQSVTSSSSSSKVSKERESVARGAGPRKGAHGRQNDDDALALLRRGVCGDELACLREGSRGQEIDRHGLVCYKKENSIVAKAKPKPETARSGGVIFTRNSKGSSEGKASQSGSTGTMRSPQPRVSAERMPEQSASCCSSREPAKPSVRPSSGVGKKPTDNKGHAPIKFGSRKQN